MTGEDLMDWACGYYDEFQQRLYDGEIDKKQAQELFNNNLITKWQFDFAMEYLTEE